MFSGTRSRIEARCVGTLRIHTLPEFSCSDLPEGGEAQLLVSALAEAFCTTKAAIATDVMRTVDGLEAADGQGAPLAVQNPG